MIKSDKWIRDKCTVNNLDMRQLGKEPMIAPYFDRPVRYVDIATNAPSSYKPEVEGEEVPEGIRKVISYGRSSYGYDVRFTTDIDQIKVFSNMSGKDIDPKRMCKENFATPMLCHDETGAPFVRIPPNSYIQGPTMEYFRIPRDVLVIVLGKSTYARSALIANVTPIEPEFEGEVVIEIANVTTSPVRVYLGEGCAQFCFFQSDEACETSYKDKGGKYQGQTGLRLAQV